MKRVMIFINPASRQGQACRKEVLRWLKEKDFQVLDPKDSDIHAFMLAHQRDVDVVLVGGGDGTLCHALPGLIETKLPVLLIPLGTANNLARTLKLPTDTSASLSLLKTGRVDRIDVGLANKIPFMNVVGLGLSTRVNQGTSSGHKKFLGVFAFVLTTFKIAFRMVPFRVHIDFDGKTHRSRSWQITVCNGRNYGSGLTIHEDASLRDQRLHGLSTELLKWWDIFTLIPSLVMGKYRAEQDVTPFEGKSVRITTKRPMHVDIDGDIRTKTPVEISVLPQALSILIPT